MHIAMSDSTRPRGLPAPVLVEQLRRLVVVVVTHSAPHPIFSAALGKEGVHFFNSALEDVADTTGG